MSILITGSTGKFGKNSIEFLLSNGVDPKSIIALVRDESKGKQFQDKGLNFRIGDYSNEESLVKEFDGIEKLLFISSSDIENRIDHHNNVIKAAKQVGSIKHLVYTSFLRKEEVEKSGNSSIDFVGKPHIFAEELIEKSGINYTILQNILYTDFLTEFFFGEKVLENGIFFPAGNGIGNYATRKDMAEAAVNILLDENQQNHLNKKYIISNEESSSFEDAAKILSEISGKTISYTSPDVATFENTLTGFGVPQVYIQLSVAFGLAIQNNEFNILKTDLSTLLKRKPTTLKQFLFDTYQ
ncbi:hypothetical protein DDB_G0268206 [Dictyostelium discoideum AX4]|uniref:NmrA-like domain-containing protein n=1 Tax=Dictyostelium discoideum TaxID=44689 RepID=Q55F90_DICDI|nr:hypothetical protein DDB_G0268206 [Dictyostelium discoideum AX4]EAL73556.1 hypothetical protein DDB_G0268206 [Dictyostelium discoideum AX4]|eukprot:XP_647643.1 hypothetical protein DDB_G0268206 [Dictyostelium discoideum AX4]